MFFFFCVCVCIGRPLIAHKHCTESLPDPLGETASKQLSVFFFFFSLFVCRAVQLLFVVIVCFFCV